MGSIYFTELTGSQQVPRTNSQQFQSSLFSKRMNALHSLQPAETEAVEALIQTTFTVSGQQEILHEHQPAKEALVLLEGMACHYKVLNHSDRQITGLILPGDFCDFAFLSSSVTRDSVMSLGPALVGRIDLQYLAAAVDKNPPIMVAAMRAAFQDQSCASELVISLGARDALQRVAHLLCEVHYRLSMVCLVSADGQFPLAMTQAELGEALGLSAVHMNRTIQHLRKRNLIILDKCGVKILDLPGLEAVAGFCDGYLRTD